MKLVGPSEKMSEHSGRAFLWNAWEIVQIPNNDSHVALQSVLDNKTFTYILLILSLLSFKIYM